MSRRKTTKLKISLKSYFKKPSLIGFLLVIFFGAQYYINNNPELKEFNNKDVRVIDGDSLALGELRIRMQGIDAPELKQECKNNESQQLYKCGQVSKSYLTSLIAGQDVKCSNQGLDRYKRQLAYCYVGEVNLNQEMVRSGNALAYIKYDESFIKEEQEAKSNKAGIWSSKFKIPEKWRAHQRKKFNQ
jgi:endonuclease YncB( thermonuclease family)